MQSRSILLIILMFIVGLGCDNSVVVPPTEPSPATTLFNVMNAVNSGAGDYYLAHLSDDYAFISKTGSQPIEFDRFRDLELLDKMFSRANAYDLDITYQNVPKPPTDITEYTTDVSYTFSAETSNFAYCAEGSGTLTFIKSTAGDWLISEWDDNNTGEVTSLPNYAAVTLGELKLAFE